MQTLIPGHKYLLSNIKSDDGDKDINILKFYDVQGENRDEIVGTSNQEVLRALIDRVSYLDNELPHSFNKEIIFHLRKALILHEARHLTRIVDKGIAVEEFPVGNDGHFICMQNEAIEHEHCNQILKNKKDLSRGRETTVGEEKRLFGEPTLDAEVTKEKEANL